MKVSTKGRYGVRIMLELALHYDKELVTVRTIAARQKISEKYIEQIISLLNKAGMVHSQRGASGGYKLACPPSTISVGQILKVTEGPLSIVECSEPNVPQCERRNECVTSEVWVEVRNAVEKVIESITLETLVMRYNEKCSYNYVI